MAGSEESGVEGADPALLEPEDFGIAPGSP